MSRIIKGYRLQGQPAPTRPEAAVSPQPRVVASGRVPRHEVAVLNQTAPVGPAAAAAATPPIFPVAGARPSVGPAAAAGLVSAQPVEAAQRQPGSAVQEQVDLLLARAQAKADLMLRQAEERAELLIDQAVNGAQALVDEARRTGRQEGYEEGLKEGREAAEALRREAQEIREAALAERDRFFAESREELVRLALAVARQVIRQELEQDPSRVLPLVDEALARVRGEDHASLRLAHAAASALEAQREELAIRHGIGELRLVPDGNLEAGDVQVQTPAGTVDARVERQLGALSQTLTRVVRHV